MKFLCQIILLCLVTSCNTNIKYPEGGYDYPKPEEVRDTNFYFYPVRNVISKKDSLARAEDFLIYHAFNEPNLSIKPVGNNTFRFMYYSLSQYPPFIITLNGNEIIVKQSREEHMFQFDSNKLDATERLLAKFNFRDYPLNDTTVTKSKWRRWFNDSMIKIYPQLLNPSYLLGLSVKMYVPKNPPFQYTTTKIVLSKEKADSLIQLINASGFWQLQPTVRYTGTCTSSGSFSLEANTKEKYNYVSRYECPYDSSDFTKACQQLAIYAGLEKEIALLPIETKQQKDNIPAPIKVM